MNDSDSVKKLIMDSACKVALDEHLDEVNFNLKPQEHSYRDCMTVIFGKGRKRISTIFMMDEFLDMKSDLYPIAISSYLRENVDRSSRSCGCYFIVCVWSAKLSEPSFRS